MRTDPHTRYRIEVIFSILYAIGLPMSFVSLLRKTALALVRSAGHLWVVSMVVNQSASHLKALSDAQKRSFLVQPSRPPAVCVVCTCPFDVLPLYGVYRHGLSCVYVWFVCLAKVCYQSLLVLCVAIVYFCPCRLHYLVDFSRVNRVCVLFKHTLLSGSLQCL